MEKVATVTNILSRYGSGCRDLSQVYTIVKNMDTEHFDKELAVNGKSCNCKQHFVKNTDTEYFSQGKVSTRVTIKEMLSNFKIVSETGSGSSLWNMVWKAHSFILEKYGKCLERCKRLTKHIILKIMVGLTKRKV